MALGGIVSNMTSSLAVFGLLPESSTLLTLETARGQNAFLFDLFFSSALYFLVILNSWKPHLSSSLPLLTTLLSLYFLIMYTYLTQASDLWTNLSAYGMMVGNLLACGLHYYLAADLPVLYRNLEHLSGQRYKYKEV